MPHACSLAHTEIQLQTGSDHWAMSWLLLTEPCRKEKVMLEEIFMSLVSWVMTQVEVIR